MRAGSSLAGECEEGVGWAVMCLLFPPVRKVRDQIGRLGRPFFGLSVLERVTQNGPDPVPTTPAWSQPMVFDL